MKEVKITVLDLEKRNLLFLIRFYLRVAFHFLGVVLFLFVLGFGCYLWFLLASEQFKTDDPSLVNIKWFTPLFLTNWNFVFQTCFLSMSLVYDLMEWLDRHDSKVGRTLKYYSDILFSGVVVPLSLFISTMFWTVYWIDRELVFPKVYDELVPWWFNHCVHTNILIVVAMETMLTARRHPANLKLELWLNGIAGVSYAVVYYTIFFLTNRWLYGVFGIMTWWQVCLFQILIWTSTFVYYYIQFPINRIFHKEGTTSDVLQIKDFQNGEMKS